MAKACDEWGEMLAVYGKKKEEGMNGTQLIAKERRRQIKVKKFDSAHDDQHTDGSIRAAALAILYDFEKWQWPSLALQHWKDEWPMGLAKHVEKKYSKEPIRRLAIAGALIAAEIDRFQRTKRAKCKSRPSRVVAR